MMNKQWEKIQVVVPNGPIRSYSKRRPWKDKQEVLESILWIVMTGARWRDLPEDYPPYQTCHRWFKHRV
jgi:transposase